MSVFVATTAIKKTATPAEHIASAMGEIPKNAARMVGCIDF
jgi:hypothetical protein